MREVHVYIVTDFIDVLLILRIIASHQVDSYLVIAKLSGKLKSVSRTGLDLALFFVASNSDSFMRYSFDGC